MRYFDTHRDRRVSSTSWLLARCHPRSRAVRIDGEPYWDGGIYSNTPIEAVLDDKPRRDSLIFAVNVWHQTAPEPESIWQVMGRQKDIQYASRADSHIARQKQIHRLRHVIRELTRQLPAARQSDRQGARSSPRGAAARRCTLHTCWRRASKARTTRRTSTSHPQACARAARPATPTTMRMLERAPWTATHDPIEGVIEHV